MKPEEVAAVNGANPSYKKSLEHILGQQYTVFDGLTGMYVEDIYQDRHGLLWIGTTDGGVSKYDGQTFQSIRLGQAALENIVDAILRDSQVSISVLPPSGWDRGRLALVKRVVSESLDRLAEQAGRGLQTASYRGPSTNHP